MPREEPLPAGARPAGVLIVGGDPRQVGDLAAALAALGMGEPTVCADGLEALEYLFRTGRSAGRSGPDPRLIFVSDETDIVSGRDVVSRLRFSRALSGLPVVLFGKEEGSPQEDGSPEHRRLGTPVSHETVAEMLISAGLSDGEGSVG